MAKDQTLFYLLFETEANRLHGGKHGSSQTPSDSVTPFKQAKELIDIDFAGRPPWRKGKLKQVYDMTKLKDTLYEHTLLFFEEALRERTWQRADIYEKVEVRGQ